MIERFYTRKEVADILHRSLGKVDLLLAEGKLRKHQDRPNGKVSIPESSVNHYLFTYTR